VRVHFRPPIAEVGTTSGTTRRILALWAATRAALGTTSAGPALKWTEPKAGASGQKRWGSPHSRDAGHPCTEQDLIMSIGTCTKKRSFVPQNLASMRSSYRGHAVRVSAQASRAYQQNPEPAKRWLEKDDPAIRRQHALGLPQQHDLGQAWTSRPLCLQVRLHTQQRSKVCTNAVVH
jgi:hypothetical protein